MRFNWTNPDRPDWIPGWMALCGLLVGIVSAIEFAVDVYHFVKLTS